MIAIITPYVARANLFETHLICMRQLPVHLISPGTTRKMCPKFQFLPYSSNPCHPLSLSVVCAGNGSDVWLHRSTPEIHRLVISCSVTKYRLHIHMYVYICIYVCTYRAIFLPTIINWDAIHASTRLSGST